MHTDFHTQAAQRRAKPAPAPRACLMRLTVDAAALSELRALVMRTCGDAMQFMRVEACDHGERAKVWLCLSRALAGQVMSATLASTIIRGAAPADMDALYREVFNH